MPRAIFGRNPVFAAIAVVTLAFGIGANTAIFTMVDALVLRGLPYRDPGRLMAIETRRAQQPEIEPFTSPPAFYDLRSGAQAVRVHRWRSTRSGISS